MKFHSGEEVDGETLVMLCTSGTMDQYVACGLKTVKQQMQLRKLLYGSQNVRSPDQSSSSTTEGACTPSRPAGKLTRMQLDQLSPEGKRVYLMA